MRQLIQEELQDLIEEGPNEGLKDYALAAGIAAGSMFGGAAKANEPAQTPTTQISSVTAKEELATVTKDGTVKVEETLAQYIKDVQKLGAQVKKVTTVFTYIKEIDGKSVTVETVIVKEGGKLRSQTFVDNKKVEPGSAEMFDAIGEFARISKPQ